MELPWILVLAVVATAGTTVAFVIRMAEDQPVVLAIGAVGLVAAFGTEFVLRRRTGWVIAPDRQIG